MKEKETEEQSQSNSTGSRNASAETADTTNPSHAHPYHEQSRADAMVDLQKTTSVPIVPKRTKTGAILVDWYYTNDQENPRNWSKKKRGLITEIIFIYTAIVYSASAIYSSSEGGVEKAFGVNSIDASLGLSMYVLGYGVGPLVLSPLSEIGVIGRNPVYIITMALFVILSIPPHLCTTTPVSWYCGSSKASSALPAWVRVPHHLPIFTASYLYRMRMRCLFGLWPIFVDHLWGRY